jgi:Fur family transcriptional regulator, iron response regulator
MTEPTDNSAIATAGGSFADAFAKVVNGSELDERLRRAGVGLTLQRLAIAHVMLETPVHLTADEVRSRVRVIMPEVSRATVYNTLMLFKEKGLLREIIVNAEQVVFDSTPAPHHHFYDLDTGKVTDVPTAEIKVVGTPNLPPDYEIESVELVVRVRRRRPRTP